MADETGTTFNPDHVPPFPVFTLQVDEEEHTVALDGAPVVPAPGQHPRDAGIAAVVEQLHARQLEAARVRVTTPGEDAWRMIVTADAEVYDTTPPDEETTQKAITRRRLLMGGGALALLGLGGGAAAVLAPRLLTPAPPAPWQPPGQGAQIPAATPPGFVQNARWAVPVGRSSDLCQISTGHIGTVSDDNVLTLRHPETAQPQWTGANAPDAINGAVRTRWSQDEVIAVASPTSLTVWPLATTDPSVPATPTTFQLEPEHRAELRGPRPFIELTEWIVDLPADNMGTRRITIPAGSRAALHQDNGTLHALGADRVFHLDADGNPHSEHQLNLPNRNGQMPQGVWALDADLVLAAWQGDGARLTLIRPSDGAVLMDTTVQDRIDQRSKTRFLGADCLFVSRTLVAYGTSPFARAMDDFTPTAAHGSTLYGVSKRVPATLELKADATPVPWHTFREDDPAPRIVTDQAAFIIAPQLDETIACCAARA